MRRYHRPAAPLVRAVSDRVQCLGAGETIAVGSADEVLRDPAVVASYLGSHSPAAAGGVARASAGAGGHRDRGGLRGASGTAGRPGSSPTTSTSCAWPTRPSPTSAAASPGTATPPRPKGRPGLGGARRRLLQGWERLSPPQLAKMWNDLMDGDPSTAILTAWIAKEELRALLRTAHEGWAAPRRRAPAAPVQQLVRTIRAARARAPRQHD